MPGLRHHVHDSRAVALERRAPVVLVCRSAIEFDDQLVVGEVGIDALTADVDVDQRCGELVALGEPEEGVLELGACWFALAVTE